MNKHTHTHTHISKSEIIEVGIIFTSQISNFKIWNTALVSLYFFLICSNTHGI